MKKKSNIFILQSSVVYVDDVLKVTNRQYYCTFMYATRHVYGGNCQLVQ